MTEQKDNPSKIVWDDSRVRVTRPDVWNVTGTREEIVLVFGTVPEPTGGREPEKIDLIDRVALSPYVAKRLSMALEAGIRHYESTHGPLEEKPRAASAGSPPADRGEKKTDGAALLLQLVKDLDVEAGFERSFKMLPGTLLGNRFLLGVRKKDLGRDSREKVLATCARMDMPGAFLDSFERHLPDADYVHFGFEENEKAFVSKAYLEFYEKIEKEMETRRPDGPDHFVMHLGFKWESADSDKRALTTYTWHPSLSVQDMVEKISTMLDPGQHRTTLNLAKGILGLASRRVPPRDILFLEVTEEGSPRKSFDINMYRANLQLGELYPFLMEMCRHYSVSPQQFHTLYEPVKSRIFGHLSGGMDREERDFLTVYYGVEGIQRPGARERRSIPSPRSGSLAGVESTDERAGLLFKLVNSLDVKVGFERSFKVFEKTFLADRFLLGFRRKDARQEPMESIVSICRDMDMPEDFLATFRRHLPESNIVLFGFEANERNRLCKAYLEFGDRIAEVLKENPGNPQPFPIHMAFKWDVSDNSRKTTAEYICFPGFVLQDILQRLTGEFYPGGRKTPFKIVERILRVAAAKADPSEFIYFEADEPDNPRASFDINLYSANLRMKELYPFLLDIMGHYSIPAERFHALYDTVDSHIFGHLTGGMDREGRDFLTLYFGERGSSGQEAGKA